MDSDQLKADIQRAKREFEEGKEAEEISQERLPQNKPKQMETMDNDSCVVYVGHIPLGFEEEAIKKFFSQFGKVANVRVSRSAKTGKPRGYAFVEFLHPKVAKAAAYALNDYIMFGKTLKVTQLKRSEVRSNLFNAKPRRVGSKKLIKSGERYTRKRNNSILRSNVNKRKRRQGKSDEARKAKISSKGIEYTPPERK